ncbi:MAG: hypothetical protein AAGA60_23335 [Cyanobacteria bacterium P01_E01_bin.42]
MKLDTHRKPIEKRLQTFERRFGKQHLIFAYHAAFPLALTPDLLQCLWANFRCDTKGEVLDIPWVAVNDFLLSGLCEEVGEELYCWILRIAICEILPKRRDGRLWHILNPKRQRES